MTAHEERISLPAALTPDLPEGRSERYVVYSVLDALLASTFDALEAVELQLDALAETMAEDDGGGLSRSRLLWRQVATRRAGCASAWPRGAAAARARCQMA